MKFEIIKSQFAYQVGLELSEIDVEGTVESERGGDRGDNLTNQTVEIRVGWSLNVQVAAADIVDSLKVS